MVSKVIIHSSVLLSIVNDIERRRHEEDAAFGYIFGKCDNNTVYLNNSHMAPSDIAQHEARYNSPIFKTHLVQYQRVYPTQNVVAWYTTNKKDALDLITNSQPLRDFQSLIVLIMEMTETSLEITTYSLKLCGIPGTIFQILLMPVPYKISSNPVEISAITHLFNHSVSAKSVLESNEISGPNVKLNKSMVDATANAVSKTHGNIVSLLALLDEKKDSPEAKIVLSRLKNVLTSIQYNANIDHQEQKQDLLMMLYLAGLTKTTLLVGNRMNEIL